jgi:ABC-type glycerol-3-phosphate transport system substrate-binding protein
MPSHVLSGKLLSWDQLPGLEDVIQKHAPYDILNSTIIEGKRYSVCLYQWVTGMQYNKSLLQRADFSAPPKTLAEWEQACIAISKLEPGKTYGTALPLAFTDYANWQVQFPALPAVGHYIYNFSTQQYQFADYAPYFESLRRIIQGGGMFPGIESLDDDQMRAQFSEGNLGFIVGGA